MNFWAQNAGTIITLAVLIIIIAGIIFKLRKDKKKGKCSCGCQGCPSRELCKGTENGERRTVQRKGCELPKTTSVHSTEVPTEPTGKTTFASSLREKE